MKTEWIDNIDNNVQCTMNNVQWKKVKLGEVGYINPPNKDTIPNQFVYIDLECVLSGQLLFENQISKKNAPSRAQRIVNFNDVLYQTVRPYQQNNYIHKKQGNYVASTGYALIRCYEDYEPDFVYYLLHTHKLESVVLGLCTGTSYPAIAPNNLKRIEISIPSLTVQRRIAAILSSADKVIASTQKVIDKLKQIKQGMMDDLLKPKDGWSKVKLEEVGKIITGSTPSTAKSEYWDGEYNFYSPADFDDSIYCSKTERTITKEGLGTGRIIPANSIMVACIASIGKIAVNKTVGITNQQINTIVPNDNNDYLFLYYLLLHNTVSIKNSAAQTTIPIINKEDFSNLLFRIPDLVEQRKIARFLQGIDKKIEAETNLLNKYKEVKKGLMEKLLNE